MTEFEYDLAVIGAGAAGLTAAGAGAALGAKTALVESARFGGDCTWHGCVPSKALLRAASIAAEARAGGAFGVESTTLVRGDRVLERIRAVRERIYHEADSPTALARYGIETFRATARFVNPHTVALEGGSQATLTARRFVIATGSRPVSLDLGVPALDPETVWEMKSLPPRLLVVGGGPVAVELAQAFARLSVAVTLVTQGPRILERDAPEAAEVVAAALRADGVTLHAGRRVRSAVARDGVVTATLSDETCVAAECVLVAIGRAARIEGVGLEHAGVAVKDGLIDIDARCRTNVSHIYAAGDCATLARFTHVGERMAAVAVTNAIAGLPVRFNPDAVVWTTFTDPELAHVGPTLAKLREERRRYRVESFPYARLDRAIVDGALPGFARIVTTPRGRVLAGTVVGQRAGELIAEIALARERALPLGALSATMHAYPTYAMSVRRAADASLIRKRTPLVVAALRLFRGLRGKAPPLEALLTL